MGKELFKNMQGRFRYTKSNTACGATALTFEDGTPREEIAQGRIGTRIVPGTPGGKYLYDSYAYDSPLEKDNMTADIKEVVVYGKIPRNSIAIPTITGGMYSPDFMYVVKKASGEKELNIVVETNDMQRGAAEKIGGFMETATAKPESEPPDPPEESRCKVIPFEKVG